MKQLNSYKKYSKMGLGYFLNKRIFKLKKSNKKLIMLYLVLIFIIVLISKLF